MRVRVKIDASTIQLTLCSNILFNYTLGLSSSITLTSKSVPNQKCSKADESIYFNYITSAASYSVDADGLITFIDNSNKSIISLVLQ
jgi:hypothetical protein